MKNERRQGRNRTAGLDVKVEQEALIQSIASIFSDAMEEQGLDKATLADRLDTSRPNVTQLLRGDRNMSLRTIATLAFALGVRITVGKESLARPEVKKERWEHRGGTEWRPRKLRVASGR